MFRKIIRFKLRILARLVLLKYKPKIIAVTGSVGKTSAKEAIFCVLNKYFSVKKSELNLNTDIGVPLTIIGGVDTKRNIFLWIFNFLKGLAIIIFPFKYPKILILEYAADKPGEIFYLAKYFKPYIGIITTVGQIPVHVEFYSGPEAVLKEKSFMISGLNDENWAILNFDDKRTLGLKNKIKAKILTFGFGEGADIKVSDYKIDIEDDVPQGIGFRLQKGESFVPVKIKNAFGKSQTYASAIAAAVGLIFDLNLIKISEALADYKPPKNRLSLIKGIKDTYVIDDTYNSSPQSTHEAIDLLREIPAKRKIAVLGDMKELGKYAFEEHEKISELLIDFVGILILVGDLAKLIGIKARELNFPEDRIFYFDNSEQAGLKLQELLGAGDLVLVKGSRAMMMEKIVEEIKLEV